MNTVLAAFLLGFPALFSIVNPVSGAFIFRTRTLERSHAERIGLARRVGKARRGFSEVSIGSMPLPRTAAVEREA